MPCGIAKKVFEKEKEEKVIEFSPAIMRRKERERIQLTLCRMTYGKDLGANGCAVVLGHVQTGVSGTASLWQRQPE